MDAVYSYKREEEERERGGESRELLTLPYMSLNLFLICCL